MDGWLSEVVFSEAELSCHVLDSTGRLPRGPEEAYCKGVVSSCAAFCERNSFRCGQTNQPNLHQGCQLFLADSAAGAPLPGPAARRWASDDPRDSPGACLVGGKSRRCVETEKAPLACRKEPQTACGVCKCQESEEVSPLKQYFRRGENITKFLSKSP